jgi:hypothetical protein
VIGVDVDVTPLLQLLTKLASGVLDDGTAVRLVSSSSLGVGSGEIRLVLVDRTDVGRETEG